MRRVAAAAFAAIVACGPSGGPPSAESCKADEACQAHGRCAYDRASEKCVVGSDADCKSSRACQKDGLCFKEGTTCTKRE